MACVCFSTNIVNYGVREANNVALEVNQSTGEISEEEYLGHDRQKTVWHSMVARG